MKIFGNIFIYTGLYFIYSVTLGRSETFNFWQLIIFTAIALPMLAFGKWVVEQQKAVDQMTDEELVAGLIDPDKDLKLDFFLYLRPFEITNVYKISTAHHNLFSAEYWEGDEYDDIERVVAKTLRPTAPFVALGRPGEHRGAARILTTDEQWQEAIFLLAKKTKLIILVPSYHEGTLWEIDMILKNGWLDKTIFLMPPTNNGWYICSMELPPDTWKKTQGACNALGLFLPDEAPEGLIFRMKSATQGIDKVPIPSPNPIAWKKAFQKLINLG